MTPNSQMTLSKQQPVVTGVLQQSAARLHQPLQQAGQGPLVDFLRQHQPPHVSQVVGNYKPVRTRMDIDDGDRPKIQECKSKRKYGLEWFRWA
jgi:hypothetical protein